MPVEETSDRIAFRSAEIADVEHMVDMSEASRSSLVPLSPRFWRKAADSREKQDAWFRILLPLDDTIAVVAEMGSRLRAFAIGRLQEAPPVYAPGGPVCLIDDFCVASDAEWHPIGTRILNQIERRAHERGAVLSIVICPHLGGAKRRLLQERGFRVTAEWHVREL